MEGFCKEVTGRNNISRAGRVFYGIVAVLCLCGAVMTVISTLFYGFPVMEMKIPLATLLVGVFVFGGNAVRGCHWTR